MSRMLSVIPCVLVISALPLFAQDEARPHRAMPRYNLANEIRVQGMIEDVEQSASLNGLAGSYLTLRTPTQTLHVQLGTFRPAKNVVHSWRNDTSHRFAPARRKQRFASRAPDKEGNPTSDNS